MKRSIMIAMSAALALASCQTDDILDNQPGRTENANAAIRFDGEAGKITRTTVNGETAANALNKKFVVYGTKTVSTGDNASTTSVVYNYYNVEWKGTNTNEESTTNTKGWEYVGVTANQLNSNNQAQTIKYWDYSASQYDFVAFSFGEATQGTETQTTDDTDTSNDNKVIASITKEGNNNNQLKELKLTGKVSELAKCYVADRVTATKPASTTNGQTDTQTSYVSTEYNKPVNLNFHSMATKIQLKIYEEINGYSVKDVKFYANESDKNPTLTPTLFTDTDKKIPTGSDKATVTVTFNDGNSDASKKNLAEFSWEMASDATQSSSITFGTLKEHSSSARLNTRADEGITIATDKNNASESDIITSIPAKLDGGLNLKVDYTLVSDDGSNETIKVTGAKVKIDSKFTDWKQNTAYTYIFKIADNTNGSTGGDSGVEGLHPIVFDAFVTETENGTSSLGDIELKDASSTPSTPSSDSGSTKND